MLDNRFWSKVIKAAPDDCWLWIANKNNHGYGLFRPGGTAPKKLAHRLSFQAKHGTIPDGLCVLHRCDNPPCVNPRHLFLGTKKDNVTDMITKGRKVIGKTPTGDDNWMRKYPEKVLRGDNHPLRKKPWLAARGTKVATARLSNADVLKIYELRLLGETPTKIAQKYQMDISSVGDICNGVHWKHLLGKDGAPTLDQLLAVPKYKTSTKLKFDDIPVIRQLMKDGFNNHQIADRFSVHHATISDIRRGITWRNN